MEAAEIVHREAAALRKAVQRQGGDGEVRKLRETALLLKIREAAAIAQEFNRRVTDPSSPLLLE